MSAISAAAPAAVSQEFYEHQRLQLFALVAKSTGMVTDVSALVADYAIHLDLFGSAEWKRYFNQDVGEEPTLPDAFWKFWRSPDPADPAQKVWETHLPPVLRPEFVVDLTTQARREFCLTVMSELMQKPKEGHASKYTIPDSKALRQHGNNEAGPACWLVVRKDVIGRGQPYAQQLVSINNLNAGYEAGPSALDLVTVLFTRFVATHERNLGDDTGREGLWTFSRCKETVIYEKTSLYDEEAFQVVVGGHSLVVGVQGGLCVHDGCGYDFDGSSKDRAVAALRKFPIQENNKG